jgi:hypothetical protein
MEAYRNLSGTSGVTAFEIRKDSIVVRFKDGDEYLYNHQAPGREQVEHMKLLAQTGRGLSTYISRTIRNHYAQKTK